ncbi:MAG: arylsulfatase [Pirellulaceae bacterium]|nr:arylsulfatase [Pirellulaceae bacterium]
MFVGLLALSSVVVGAESERPNIVIMMADDMGFSDIGCYGGEIHTPALDELAASGVRFTQFYNTGRCCPTRASLLSGLYPHQAGVGWMMSDDGYDGYRGELNRNCVTIAEVLGASGYRTYMSGKWHVTKSIGPDGPKDNWPRQRGFDRFFGTIHGAGSFFDPASLTRDNTQIPPGEDFYYTDAISENAAQYVVDHADAHSGKPFFMYVAYTAPHWPMHALPEDIRRYRGEYDNGWEAIRTQRYLRMLKMGLIKQEWGLTDRDSTVPPWPEAELRDWHIRRMEVYAAMIDRMDQGVSRIVKALKKTDQFDNTLILFLADNGGCAEEYGSRGAVRPDPSKLFTLKALGKDGLQSAMQPPVTRDGRPVKTGEGVLPGPADTYVAYGKPWANVSNTPFRMYKHWVHEGGISSPLIAHWPARIDRAGELENQPGHLIDLMATCVDVAGAEYPQTFKEKSIKPLEGRSLVPAFSGKQIEREALYWEHEGNRAVRVGKWKLVAKGEKGPWELYDLDKDRTERNDLSEAQPERAEKMAALWQAYAERANVLPLNPRNKRKANFTKKKRFQLTQGANLSRERAPFVEKKPLTIDAVVGSSARDGVIVAQGGDAQGFSLYLKAGKIHFATRRNGKLTVLSSTEKAPDGKLTIHLRMSKTGAASISVNGAAVAAGQGIGPLIVMPIDGLQVGADLNGAVGDYQAPFKLDGDIQVRLAIE